MNAAEELIAQARHGRFSELLPDLLAMARRADGDRDEVWEATAAAIQILFWQDRFAEAAELAEAIIAQDGPLGGELCDQDVPFRSAFLAAELHGGTPAPSRLLAAAEHVPAGRNLSEDLLWLAEQLPERPVEELLPSHFDWGGPARSLDVATTELLERGFNELAATDKSLVWQALAKANDFERAHAVAEASDEKPDRFATCLWMAGWYAVRGDIPRGEQMLLAAHSRWWPYMKWDAIPDAPVLQLTLRLVTTDRVREQYLTRPIGPEAAEKNA
ncbi:hypothetical protein GCM10010193_58740 [Kitasatospora atroaurantiaca]|uniref:Uncharacterized protein n=1 Tax=Kitasatospora atroaurantiaca TaxID=285545 RepID=A0A561EP95_9ACTN|nr:hypothetical protein [Kitasatospora atroaurantiaca]TWE17435.1 hypothetical protein FB465_2460 [Kitasatospora atroaurantiaca]